MSKKYSQKTYDDYSHYDVAKLFKDLEFDLMLNMHRNLMGHRQDEKAEGFRWSMWQAEKSKSLSKFIKENKAIIGGYESRIDRAFKSIMEEQFREGASIVDREIKNAVSLGYIVQSEASGDFFKINEGKLKSLINSIQKDMAQARTAILRKTNDVYRKVIFDAEMYAAAGTKTVNQCIDMAAEDFYKRGIACIKYKNGAAVDVAKYAAMAIRTANKRAFLTAEGLRRDEWGECLVLMSKYGLCSPACLPYQGKVYIDDVYSHPSEEQKAYYMNKGYGLLSKAIEGGAFHPNCKHTLSTFFEGISTLPEEQDITEGLTAEEQKVRQCGNMAEAWDRVSRFSLDKDNKKEANRKSEAYKSKARIIKNSSANSVAKSAKKSIIKYIKMPVNISKIKGISKEIENGISVALEHYKEKYNININDIRVVSFGKGNENKPFRFQPKKKGNWYSADFEINEDYNFNGSMNEYQSRIMRNYNKGALASKSLEDLIGHEMAHFMTFAGCDTWEEFVELEAKVSGEFIKGISLYSDETLDGAESLAEAFIRIKNGERVPKEAEKLVEKYIERWRK